MTTLCIRLGEDVYRLMAAASPISVRDAGRRTQQRAKTTATTWPLHPTMTLAEMRAQMMGDMEMVDAARTEPYMS